MVDRSDNGVGVERSHPVWQRLTRAIMVGVVVVCLSAVLHANLAAARPNAVTLTLSAPATINGCDETQLQVWVNDVVGLYGVDIQLSFAPDVLEVVDSDTVASGIQVENGSFLKPGLIVINNADNSQGTIRYAMTQLNPTAPASGSGLLFVVHLRARSEQSAAPVAFVRKDLADRNGGTISSTAVDGSIGTVAPDEPSLSIRKLNATDSRLSWTEAAGVTDYHLYRSTAPYFAPAEPAYRVTTGLSYDDLDSLGDPIDNYYYVVKSACPNGFKSKISNRDGEFDFSLVRGTP